MGRTFDNAVSLSAEAYTVTAYVQHAIAEANRRDEDCVGEDNGTFDDEDCDDDEDDDAFDDGACADDEDCDDGGDVDDGACDDCDNGDNCDGATYGSRGAARQRRRGGG